MPSLERGPKFRVSLLEGVTVHDATALGSPGMVHSPVLQTPALLHGRRRS